MSQVAECVGGPLDGERRPIAMYGARWGMWSGAYWLASWRGIPVYRWVRT